MTHSTNSLIPESPVLVYPTVAARFGLEEAVMLSILTTITRSYRGQDNNGYAWFTLEEAMLQHLMPFWQPQDIQRIATSLREQSALLIASSPYVQSRQLKFALQTAAASQQQGTQHRDPSHTQATSAANFISPSWTPDKETLQRIALHNIPQEFCLQQVPEFVTYWRERKETAHAWGSKFMNHVMRKWRDFETQQHAMKKVRHMQREWRPSEDAMEVLTKHASISRQFVEDAIPEFVLYWREQGSSSDNWNKKFRDHVHRQWLRYQSACEHDPTPRRLPENWRPSTDVFEVLQLANIDTTFAESLLPEFVIYHRDSNQVNSSWNTRFLQFTKKRWASRHAQSAESTQRSTRELSIAEQLTDRSWAL